MLWETNSLVHMPSRQDVPQGTLALMVLRTLDVLGPLHGYGIGRRIEEISKNTITLNHGTLYPVLRKLELEGAIRGEWRTSENNQRAKYYAVTAAGRKELAHEQREWQRTANLVQAFLQLGESTT
jgi:PadR family transcriptional regulator, regulatory protein PadR